MGNYVSANQTTMEEPFKGSIIREVKCNCTSKTKEYLDTLTITAIFNEDKTINLKFETIRTYNSKRNHIHDLHPLCLTTAVDSEKGIKTVDMIIPDNDVVRLMLDDLIMADEELDGKYPDHHPTDTRARIIGFLDSIQY